MIIIDANVKVDGVAKYILYTIQGSEGINYFRFKRRYQDFY